MSKKLVSFFVLLGSLLLIASYFFISDRPDTTESVVSQEEARNDLLMIGLSEELAVVQEELGKILEAGGHINPERHDEIEQQINDLVEQGLEQEKAEQAFLVLAKLEIGGREKEVVEIVPTEPAPAPHNADPISKPSPEETSPILPMEMDTQDEVEEQSYDVEEESGELSDIGPLPPPSPSCERNRNPVFTHHITDVGKINYIAPPPTVGRSPDGSSQLKTHGYIGTDGKRVPVYAPVDMTLDTGSHYTGGPYWLGFEISCEVRMRVAHITEPVQKIKEVFPAKPGTSSGNSSIKHTVPLKAGELIGYTIGTNPGAGNWDFGVYDLSSRNRYAESSELGWVAATAVCPFDYYPEEMRAVYSDKFDTEILSGNPLDGESFCR